MPLNLSIKTVPDDLVQRLRERAARNHRSLQGELMAIIEEAVRPARYRTINVCLSKIRRSPDDRDRLLTAYRARRTIQIETLDLDHGAVLALTQRTGLTGCDASYLHLARVL